MSRGFLCSLLGLGMTVWSWYSGPAWPAWPGLALMSLFFEAHFAEYPIAGRGAIIVLLIAVNSAVWALVAYGVLQAIAVARARWKAPSR